MKLTVHNLILQHFQWSSRLIYKCTVSYSLPFEHVSDMYVSNAIQLSLNYVYVPVSQHTLYISAAHRVESTPPLTSTSTRLSPTASLMLCKQQSKRLVSVNDG